MRQFLFSHPTVHLKQTANLLLQQKNQPIFVALGRDNLWRLAESEDVKDLQPLRNVNDIELLEREDKDFSKNTEQQELLLNAPKKNGNFFTVPKVIE